MSSEKESAKKLASLLDDVLEINDPAAVGLKKIIKSKKEDASKYPLHKFDFDHMDGSNNSEKIFTKDEKVFLKLEKKNADLRVEIETLKENIEKEKNNAHNEGYEKGVKEGTEKGQQSAEEEYRKKLDRVDEKLRDMLESISRAEKCIYKEAHKKVIDLSVEIARKIINSEIQTDPHIISGVVEKTLYHIVNSKNNVIRVAPNDFPTVMEKKDYWHSISESLDKITIVEDPMLEPGGCVIESDTGVADSRIDVQFDQLREVIESAWESAVSHESTIDDLMPENKEEKKTEDDQSSLPTEDTDSSEEK